MRISKLQVISVVVLILIIFPFAAHAVPPIVGADGSYVVMSGSMEPAIGVGSVIWIKDVPAENIEEGDVITFGNIPDQTTTHRVIQKSGQGENSRYVTKGDANEDPDAEVVRNEEVLGVVMITIPYLGYLIGFAGTDLGIIVFLIVPAVLLVVGEIWDLYRAATSND